MELLSILEHDKAFKMETSRHLQEALLCFIEYFFMGQTNRIIVHICGTPQAVRVDLKVQ